MRHPLDEFGNEERRALEGLFSGEELSREQALLFTKLSPKQVMALGLVADSLRESQCGDRVGYVVNRNINFTNVCIKSCRFCAFSRDHRDEEGYYLDLYQVLERVA